MSAKTDQKARERKIAKEQSLTELEQAIGDREQLAGDRDQARIDLEQTDHDEQRDLSTTPDQRLATIFDDRQARIDREQINRDVKQEAVDHAQEGRDTQQEALDETRATINLPASQQPDTADPSTVHQGATIRARAAHQRVHRDLAQAFSRAAGIQSGPGTPWLAPKARLRRRCSSTTGRFASSRRPRDRPSAQA